MNRKNAKRLGDRRSKSITYIIWQFVQKLVVHKEGKILLNLLILVSYSFLPMFCQTEGREFKSRRSHSEK